MPALYGQFRLLYQSENDGSQKKHIKNANSITRRSGLLVVKKKVISHLFYSPSHVIQRKKMFMLHACTCLCALLRYVDKNIHYFTQTTLRAQ